MRHRVAVFVDLDVVVQMDLAALPGGVLVRLHRQGPQGGSLVCKGGVLNRRWAIQKAVRD